MSEIFDTVLLLALPASGKSEIRKFLDVMDTAGIHLESDIFAYQKQ